MENLIAKLVNTNQIIVKVNNSFYDGLTEKVYLRSEVELIELHIQKKTKNKVYTNYSILLDGKLDLGQEYEIVIDRALRTILNIEEVIQSKTFDEEYFYDGPLGNFYSKDNTTFYLWAPTATSIKVDIMTKNGTSIVQSLNRVDKGVFTTSINGDLELASYTYIIKTSGVYNEAVDPYAYSSTPNSKRSVIIDLNKINKKTDKSKLGILPSFTDYIIYETSIRDFTVTAEHIENKAKFLGLTETNVVTKEGNSCGLDYIEELGITHLQIMPFYDFGSILEENQMLSYNWGYDPVNYNVPEGSYCTDVYNPYKRVLEVKEMIQAVNNKGIRVNMDVVYNHMFDLTTSMFNNIVPKYYFRYDKNGKPSNGSFCGNDIESTHLMVRRFMVDSVKRWVTLYGVDGFRFDLMGIHDVETMNLIRKELDSIDPSIIVYGEGWHMPSTLEDGLKASIVNQEKVPNIAMFNDRYRDVLKGPHSDLKEEGFLCGNTEQSDVAATCYSGTTVGYKEEKSYMLKPTTTVNYASCHDNYTIYDQYKKKYKKDKKVHELVTLNLANLLLTQGIVFIHSGSEFFRTKLGVENSYNVSDEVNHIDWDLRDKYMDNVTYIRELIKIRKSFKGYRLDTIEEIEKHTTVHVLKPGVIEYIIRYNSNTYKHYINATKKSFTKMLGGNYSLLANKHKADIDGLEDVSKIKILPFSLVILKENN
jgi:pullulanase